jgi:transposase, IS5 family
MIERQIARCGAPPRQVAADGGYASQHNLTAAKARGVKGCRLPQRARPGGRRHGQEPLGLSQAAQLPRRERGRDFLPEASLRLARCAWRGLDYFETYIWSAVVVHNLVLLALARLKPA